MTETDTSHTWSCSVDAVKVGDIILHRVKDEDAICRVLEIVRSKPGKHGSYKTLLKLEDLLSGRVFEVIFSYMNRDVTMVGYEIRNYYLDSIKTDEKGSKIATLSWRADDLSGIKFAPSLNVEAIEVSLQQGRILMVEVKDYLSKYYVIVNSFDVTPVKVEPPLVPIPIKYEYKLLGISGFNCSGSYSQGINSNIRLPRGQLCDSITECFKKDLNILIVTHRYPGSAGLDEDVIDYRIV